MTARSRTLESVELEMTESDPLARLEELHSQGGYDYNFYYDLFKNGIMINLEIYYFISSIKYTIINEAQFIRTTNVEEAKRVISAIALDGLGLGEGLPEDPLKDMLGEAADTAIDIVRGMVGDDEAMNNLLKELGR